MTGHLIRAKLQNARLPQWATRRHSTDSPGVAMLESPGVETIADQRVVVDRNRISGVTTGIDFALTSLATLPDATDAKARNAAVAARR